MGVNMKFMFLVLALLSVQAQAATNCKLAIPTVLLPGGNSYREELYIEEILKMYRNQGYEVYPITTPDPSDDLIRRISNGRYIYTKITKRINKNSGYYDPNTYCTFDMIDRQLNPTGRRGRNLNEYTNTMYGPPSVHDPEDLCIVVLKMMASMIKPCVAP